MITYYLLTGTWSLSILFPIQLFVAEYILFFRPSENVKDIWRRILFISCYALITLFVPATLTPDLAMPSSLSFLRDVYEISVLTLYFLSLTVLMGLAYKTTPYFAIFCALAAYNCQHIDYAFQTIFQFALSIEMGSWQFYVSFLFAFALLIGFSFFLRRFLRHIDPRDIENKSLLGMTAVAVFINIVLGSLTRPGSTSLETLVIEKCYSVVSCFILLFLQFSVLKNQGLHRQLDFTELMWRKDKKNYEIIKTNTEDLNIKYHDLKHLLHSFQQTIPASSLKELESSLEQFDSQTKTGSVPLDIIISEKKLFCSKNDIRFTFLGDGKSVSFMEEGDIYSLFGNILDNAIEASLRFSDPQKRVISLTIFTKGKMAYLQCVNYYQGPLTFEEGSLVSQKEDKRYHGFGMKSIASIVEKYNGHLLISPKDGTFSLSILF